jgi:hypothetical protein
MPLVEFELATTADDADLRRLLRVNPLPGEICLSYEREPSYWAASVLDGPLHQTLVARSQDGCVVGMGSRSVRELYVNGKPSAVGYMSQMRVDPNFAWGAALPKVLAQGWRFYRQLHQDRRTPYYLASLVTGDSVAWRMMNAGLPDWPTLNPVGNLRTYALHMRRARPLPRLAHGLCLRRATPEDAHTIANCLARNHSRHQFAPVWSPESLVALTQLTDLDWRDFWLVERDAQVVGTLARWNQRRLKQSVVRGYAGVLRWAWPWVNLTARVGVAPRLPSIGEQVRHAFASHLAVDNDDADVATALLAAVYNDAVAAGDNYLMLGLDSNHSLGGIVRPYRHVVYATQLCLATWGADVEMARQVEDRQVGVEIALL